MKKDIGQNKEASNQKVKTKAGNPSKVKRLLGKTRLRAPVKKPRPS